MYFTYDRDKKTWNYCQDMWELIPIKDLNELLKNGYALCIAHELEWRNWPVLLSRIIGLDNEDRATTVSYLCDAAFRQSATKNALDRGLIYSYIFASWKRSGVRTFKMIRQGEVLAVYSNLEDALQELMPEGFKPYAECRPKVSIRRRMILDYKRKDLYRDLLRLLANRRGGRK